MFKPTLSTDIHDKNWAYLWEMHFLPVVLPLLVALVLGTIVAVLIVGENTLMACAVALAVPGAILLIRYPFTALMIWLSLIPFLPYGRVSPAIYWVLHRALIPLALGIIILSRMLRIEKHRPVRIGAADLATLIYTAVAVASIVMTRSQPKDTLFTFYDRSFVAITAYWFIRLFNPQARDLKRLIPIMLIICLAECIIGLWSWFAPQTLPEIWIFEQQGARTTGTLGNPAAYTSTLMFTMLFLFHYAMNQEKESVRRLLLLTFGLGTVCIFFSFSRGSWLASALVLLILLLLYFKPIISMLLTVLPIMIILSTTVFASDVAYAYERLKTEDTIDSRIVLAHAGQQMFLARPLFGWGYDNYDRYDWQFMERVGDAAPTEWDVKYGTSHHTYLTILAEIGLAGFFFYAFPAIWLLGCTIKVLPRLPKKGFGSWRLLIMMWLSIGFYVVVTQFMDMRFFLFPLTVLWLTLGLVADMVQVYSYADNID